MLHRECVLLSCLPLPCCYCCYCCYCCPICREDRGTDAVTVGRRVFVGNLSYDTTWADLKDHFKAAGRVAHADILTVRAAEHAGCIGGCTRA